MGVGPPLCTRHTTPADPGWTVRPHFLSDSRPHIIAYVLMHRLPRACCLLVIALAFPEPALLSSLTCLCNTDSDSELVSDCTLCVPGLRRCVPCPGPDLLHQLSGGCNARCQIASMQAVSEENCHCCSAEQACRQQGRWLWCCWGMDWAESEPEAASDLARSCPSGSCTSRAGPTYLMKSFLTSRYDTMTSRYDN